MHTFHVRREHVAAVVSLALAGCSSEGGGDASTPAARTGEPWADEMLAMHNEVRAEVKVAPLGWSDQAAQLARDYAARCKFEHNPARGAFGENLFAGTGSYSARQVVEGWADERAHYDYASNRCASGKMCGHYTQIVWRDTTEVGCFEQQCTDNSPFGGGAWTLVVCNYAPPGNYVGQKPY